MTPALPLVRLGQGAFTRDICPEDLDPTLTQHGDPMTTTLLKQIQRGRTQLPRRVMLYGVHGIGKSTFGAMAERPIFIQTEDGLANIECDRFPLATRFGHVLSALSELYTGEHDYRTVVIDSLDWLERLIETEVCEKEDVPNIEKIGYAKGYKFMLDPWREVLAGLDALRNDRGMTVVLIAHAKIEKFDNPETEPYDRYSPRLHKLASALIQEWCDEVLFATYKVHTRKIDEAFNKAKHQGIGTGERIVRTTERPAHVAKNRLGLPEEFPLDYRLYAAFVRGENPLAVETTEDAPPTEPSAGATG
jgi:hypothetical protein